MEKKVSIANIDKIIKYNKFEDKVITYKCGEEDIEIVVNQTPAFTKKNESILSGVTMVISEDGTYMPVMKTSAYSYAIVSCFTNLKTDNAIKILSLTSSTDIVNKIEKALDSSVLSMFREDFDSVIESVVNKNSYDNRIGDFVGSLYKIVEIASERINSSDLEELLIE